MSDQEFIDALQAEVKRLTDLNRQQIQDILMLHRQLEELSKNAKPKEEKPPARRRPYYA